MVISLGHLKKVLQVSLARSRSGIPSPVLGRESHPQHSEGSKKAVCVAE